MYHWLTIQIMGYVAVVVAIGFLFKTAHIRPAILFMLNIFFEAQSFIYSYVDNGISDFSSCISNGGEYFGCLSVLGKISWLLGFCSNPALAAAIVLLAMELKNKGKISQG